MKRKYLPRIALATMLSLTGSFYQTNNPHDANNKDALNEKLEYLRSEEYKQIRKIQEKKDSILNLTPISRNEIDKLIREKHKKIKPKYVDINLIREIVKQESAYNQFATSHAGAKGLMQVMNENYIKPTGKDLSDTIELYVPDINIEEGIKILKGMERYCENKNPYWNELKESEKHRLILASYNGGAKKLRDKDWNISRMPKETREYVDTVMNNYTKYKTN